MATYSWPANLAKNDAGWITSLVDWPGVTAVSDTAQASVLAASSELSNAVQKRIAGSLSIPLPSELKPGQIQIPVDADASAQLDSYVEEENNKRLKRLSEIEQANREKRSNFLSEYRVNLETVERLRDRADQAAVDFASIAVKSSFILNGGALVAIPAILQFTEKGTISKEPLIGAVILFVIGIFLSSITNYLAYQSMFKAGQGHGNELNARAIEVSDAYYPPEDPSDNQATVKATRDEAEGFFKKARQLANFGVGTYGLSILAFLIGVGIIIYGLQAESAPATLETPPGAHLNRDSKAGS